MCFVTFLIIFFCLQPLWIPEPLSDAVGREFAVTSLLGAFLSVSIFAEEDPSVAEKFFSGKQSTAAVRSIAQQLQQDMEFLRVRGINVFQEVCLVN